MISFRGAILKASWGGACDEESICKYQLLWQRRELGPKKGDRGDLQGSSGSALEGVSSEKMASVSTWWGSEAGEHTCTAAGLQTWVSHVPECAQLKRVPAPGAQGQLYMWT